MLATIANLIGMLGVILMLAAFLMTQSGKLLPTQLKFPIMNLTGAVLVLFSLLFAWNLPSFIIELCWALISVYGILRILRKR